MPRMTHSPLATHHVPPCSWVQYVVGTVLPEAEKLKVVLATKDISAPVAYTSNRPADAVRVGLSNLDGIDWSSHAPSAPPAAAAAVPDYGAFLDALGSDAPSAPPAPGSAAATAASSGSNGATSDALVTRTSYQTSFTAPSQESLQRHALFGFRSGSSTSGGGASAAAAAAAAMRPRYPGFDTTPSVLDGLWDRAAAGPREAAAAADLAGLALGHPSAGPSLGPQEVQVSPPGRQGGKGGAATGMVEGQLQSASGAAAWTWASLFSHRSQACSPAACKAP
jgi:hypothetical protein